MWDNLGIIRSLLKGPVILQSVRIVMISPILIKIFM